MFKDCPRWPRARARARALAAGGVLALLCACLPLAAQTAASAPGAASELTPAERAKRDADKVFRWILIDGEKARKPVPAKEEKALPRAKPATRPALKAQSTAASAAPEAALAQTRAAPSSAPIASAPAAAEVRALPMAEAPAARPESAAPLAAAPAAMAAAKPAEDPDVEVLVPVLRVDPKLSPALLRGVRNGEVRVRFTVLPDGSVADPKIESSSNPRLNFAALAAVAQWRFAPLRKAQVGTVELAFSLE